MSSTIRIHALAQQIRVDSKTLIDVIKQVGIEGKSTALASLNEEEAAKVKEYFEQKKKAKTINEAESSVPQFRRLAADALDKKVRVLTPTSSGSSSSRVKKNEDAEEIPQEPVETVEETTVTETKPLETETLITEVPQPEPPAEIPVESLPEPPEPELKEKEPEPEPLAPPETVTETQEEQPSALPIAAEMKEEDVPKTEPANEAETKVEETKTEETQKPARPQLPPALGRIDLSQINIPESKKTRKEKERDRKKERERKQQEAAAKANAAKPGVAGNTVANVPGRPPQRTQPLPPRKPTTTGFSAQGHAAAVRREDYRGPLRNITDKMRNLDGEPRRESDRPQDGKSRPSAAFLGLAPVPVQKNPNRVPKNKEPVAQKPTMKLPTELIRETVSTGTTTSLEALIKKHDERAKQKKAETANPKERRGRDGKIITGTPLSAGNRRKDKDAVVAQDDARRKKRPGSSRRNRNTETDDDGNIIQLQLHRQKIHGRSVNTAAPRKNDAVIQLPCTVKQFAETTGVPVPQVIKKMMMELGTIVNINTHLERDVCELLAASFDISVTIKDQISLEDRLVTSMFDQEDEPDSLRPRPPVVTVLGHVDHGKTTLLDYILHLNVVSGEKGGITQHIRAYRVQMPNGEDITFVDTPGHEAFTEMRARGANCTDIVVLVVACDDGVMPQTEEAISHAKAAGVPIIVALNKVDLPGVNIDRVIQELAAHELMPSEWGGDTEMIRCSGLTGQGVDKLLETIQVTAEIHELKANPDRSALGVALEAELQAGQGVVCKALVQKGTLKTGDVILCGTAYGRVRMMYDTLDMKRTLNEAAPSTPVNIIGLDVAPKAGSKFCVLEDISDARTIAERRLAEEHLAELADTQEHVTFETLFARINERKTVQTLNVIIRADVRGSIEAIRKELGKLEHPEVKIKILQATVGGVTEGDVQLADASDAVIVAFNVVPDENARILAERKKVQVRRYDIIYNLTDDIKKALEGMLKPVEQVKELGRALIQRVFVVSRVGTIAGCRVINGTIERDSKVRIIRDSRIIGEYPLDSLKREKDDMKEIREGYECGIKLKGFNDLKEGDILESYKLEEVARTF